MLKWSEPNLPIASPAQPPQVAKLVMTLINQLDSMKQDKINDLLNARPLVANLTGLFGNLALERILNSSRFLIDTTLVEGGFEGSSTFLSGFRGRFGTVGNTGHDILDPNLGTAGLIESARTFISMIETGQLTSQIHRLIS